MWCRAAWFTDDRLLALPSHGGSTRGSLSGGINSSHHEALLASPTPHITLGSRFQRKNSGGTRTSSGWCEHPKTVSPQGRMAVAGLRGTPSVSFVIRPLLALSVRICLHILTQSNLYSSHLRGFTFLRHVQIFILIRQIGNYISLTHTLIKTTFSQQIIVFLKSWQHLFRRNSKKGELSR